MSKGKLRKSWAWNNRSECYRVREQETMREEILRSSFHVQIKI